MQRLFSTFANGWPGLGLLIQRLVTGALLLLGAFSSLSHFNQAMLSLPQAAGGVLGVFILIGLWTPLAGTLVVLIQLWVAISGDGNEMSFMLAVFGGTLAMIGPGAWSVDARMFGRKHIAS